MTRIVQDPALFTEDALTGFVDVYGAYVRRVPGGVVRAAFGQPKVAVVVGGGSGHYPAFCGIVGPGFADAAVVGNVFTSPSAADAVSVARAADSGAGVVLITGNYAGDVLNFKLASASLANEGIENRYLTVTDDVASAPIDDRASRRGVAGDFTVFKTAGAAAEAGYALPDVVRVAEYTNDRTRSLGVAFAGCTLPGSDGPLFTIPEGRMALGMGIHGEAGIEEQPLVPAADLAAMLVDGILNDAPDCPQIRLAVILNGLGATKYEELFGLWGLIAPLLRHRGFDLVEPEVGELVTSLDMAGCSLTLTWLDEELEKLWSAPADTPAYRKGHVAVTSSGVAVPVPKRVVHNVEATHVTHKALDGASRDCAERAVRALEAMQSVMAEHADELGKLDAFAGDGDHGRGMVKGTTSAVAAAREAQNTDASAGEVLRAAAQAWAAGAGGTSGVIWGALLSQLGASLDETGTVTTQTLGHGVRAAFDAATRLGGAAPGDKTLLDALLPFSEELSRAGAEGLDLRTAWNRAAARSVQAAEDTAGMRPKVGRAKPLAERSVGHPDPGAVSLALCVTAAGIALPGSTAP